MTKDDILSLTRTRLTQYRENLKKYEKLWNEYKKKNEIGFEKDIEITFVGLIRYYKQLIWEIEFLRISHGSLKEEVDIITDFISTSTHNTTLKTKFKNDIINSREKYLSEYKSFLQYVERE